MSHRRGGANRLVRTLRILLVFVGIRVLWQVSRPVFLAHVFTHFLYSFWRDADRVGTHVSDETNRTFFAQFHAFIQPLRDHHGALHTETQLARRILLQFAGRERRRGIAATFFLVDRSYQPVGLLQGRAYLFRVLAVGDFNLLFAFAQEPRVERWRLAGGEMRVNRPIFFLLERLDLTFALDDQAESNGLHAPGRQAAAHFIPEQRRDLISYESVEHTAGLLCVD